MRFVDFDQGRVALFAEFHRHRATGVEAATGGKVNWIGRLALQDDALLSEARVWHWDHGEQGLGVWMFGTLQHLQHGADFHDAP